MKRKRYSPPGMKMDVTASAKRSVAVALAAAGLVAFLLLAWIGGELHYRNCLEEVELRHPVTVQQQATGDAARDEDLDECSRLPWT